DGIRDKLVTGVQTCALPISERDELVVEDRTRPQPPDTDRHAAVAIGVERGLRTVALSEIDNRLRRRRRQLQLLRAAAEAVECIEIGRASCRERGEISGAGGA